MTIVSPPRARPAREVAAALGPDGPGRPPADDVDRVERAFGDPDDPDNPVGHAALVASDREGQVSAAARATVSTLGFGDQFVPEHLGGRLVTADGLGRTLRSLFRRDCALGLGHAAVTLIAAAPVWTAGDLDQQRFLAARLLDGEVAAGAYTELASGHDLVRSTVRADAEVGGYRITGRKELINNLSSARTITLLARTGDGADARAHSLFLLDAGRLDRSTVRFDRRWHTSGLATMSLGGAEFVGTPVGAEALVGGPGAALETVMRSFQVTKSVLSSAILGSVDTQLRLVGRFALRRRLYGGAMIDLPRVRRELADALADTFVADCLGTSVCRSLHLLPEQASLYAAAAKALVPQLACDASERLARLLGARCFLREGPEAAVEKHLRDLPVAGLAHMGTTSCQAVIVPQLARLARRAWNDAASPPPGLHRVGDDLPALDLTRLRVTALPADPMMASLLEPPDLLRADPLLHRLHEQLRADLVDLRARCSELAPRDRTPLAGPAVFDMAERYTLLLAASCAIATWHEQQDLGADSFAARPDWLVAALARIADRLGHPELDEEYPTGVLVAELAARAEDGRSFDLLARPLSPGPTLSDRRPSSPNPHRSL